MSSPLVVLERAVRLHLALTEADLPHALGGALALAYHVHEARGTRDIDVNVTLDADHPEALFQALPADIGWSTGDVDRARRDGQVRLFWPVADAPPIPVDLFLPQHAFHSVVASRTELVPMLDARVPILSATDLTVFKALFDRTKDWGDIEELLRFGEVDEAEVARWLVEIVGDDDPRVARFASVAAEVQRPTKPSPVSSELFGRRKPRLGD